jgi:peptide chain release factor 1
MLGRLDEMRATFDELTARLADPDVLEDHEAEMRISKQRSDAEATLQMYEAYSDLSEELADAEEVFREAGVDVEMRDLAREEFRNLKERLVAMEEKLALLLIPKESNDDTEMLEMPDSTTCCPNVIEEVMLEVRAGTCGVEAAIWAADLVTAYKRYAKSQGWQVRTVDASPGDDDVGFRQYTMEVSGVSVFSKLKSSSRLRAMENKELAIQLMRSSGSDDVTPRV